MSWSAILTQAFIIALLASGIRLATPVLLAALGEIFAERSGVLNLGLEGMMLVGALGGFVGTYYSGSPWLGVLSGVIGGGLMGLLMAFLSVSLRANQVISGLALVILGQGLTAFLYREIFGVSATPPRIQGFQNIHIPVLSDIPVLGPVLFQHNILIYLTMLLVPVLWVVLFRTTLGLKIRAVGEHPQAAETTGVNVQAIRYICVTLAGALAGLGGSFLTVGQMNLFLENITAGRGWIAIALVIFARWSPPWVMAGALLFGIADALQLRFQALGFVQVPYEFLLMLPYILTVLVLVGAAGKAGGPAALGIPYIKERY